MEDNIEKKSCFFESRRKHVLTIKGEHVIGTVFWNKSTGSAFVADPRYGIRKITEAAAEKICNVEGLSGRPKLFDEPVKHVLVTLPERLIRKICPEDAIEGFSKSMARLIEKLPE